MQRVVKNNRQTQPYQRHKLERSVQQACLSVREFVGSAELTAEQVCQAVDTWLSDKHEVTSSDLRRIASQQLTSYNPAAAYVYATHNEIN